MVAVKTRFLLLILALGIAPSVMAQTAALAVPYPSKATPQAIDVGELSARSGNTPISATVALGLTDVSEAESLLKSVSTPGDPQYRQFLTSAQFKARFAPSDADVAKVIAGFAKYGLTAERTSATTVKVTGMPSAMERAFSVSLHSYAVPARGKVMGYTFHAPLSRATVPREISVSVAAIVGLDSRPSLHPLYRAIPHPMASRKASAAPATTGDSLGYLTVTDFAAQYDVQPLYNKNVSGKGHTLAIMTLASFTPSDAFAYWSALGLSVDPNRMRIVNVDGGPGAPSDDSGSLETTIDVEQSGGIAPGAKMIVYQAPNTNQGFVDLFAAAVEANTADTLSISWGDWEWLYNLENSPVIDPITGNTVSSMVAVHQLLIRAAIQGQTVFAAAGDGGAYDLNDDLGCYGPYSPSQPFSCTKTLSVDYPASDPAITAAGGTTLPGVQEFCLDAACDSIYSVDVKHERVWGWDYLDGFCAALGTPDPIECGIFPGGGGGGVSVMFDLPFYQYFISGTQKSQPGQTFIAGSGFLEYGIGLYYALPAHFPGRNVPDVSFNADPDTGYVVVYTSSVSGFGVEPYWGGTSFVGPQLNGVAALLDEYLYGKGGWQGFGPNRLGLLNGALYGLAQTGKAYKNPGAPLNAIEYGNNWFYHGSKGYNPGAGLGTMDVYNFAETLRHGQW
jgi:kumamolisin